MNTITLNSNNPIKNFLDLVHVGIQSWLQAAAIAREEISKDAEWPDKVQQQSKIITRDFVVRFSHIGVKYIPELAISDCPGAKKLRKLPLELQKQYFTQPLSLLINNNGNWETLMVDLTNLTSDQADQLFAEDRIRTEAEQRTWIEDKRAKEQVPIAANSPFRIVKDEIIFMAGARFKKRDFKRLLNDWA